MCLLLPVRPVRIKMMVLFTDDSATRLQQAASGNGGKGHSTIQFRDLVFGTVTYQSVYAQPHRLV